jgi:hypothetical protein
VPLLQGGADFLIFVASKELIFRFQIWNVIVWYKVGKNKSIICITIYCVIWSHFFREFFQNFPKSKSLCHSQLMVCKACGTLAEWCGH